MRKTRKILNGKKVEKKEPVQPSKTEQVLLNLLVGIILLLIEHLLFK